MTCLQAIRALIGDCTETELCSILMGITNAEWIRTSDTFVDAFHDAAKAVDEACADYARMIERRAA